MYVQVTRYFGIWSFKTNKWQPKDKYRKSIIISEVGMLLYLIKHSRPDIANAVCECTKVLDGAMEYAYHEMLRIIKYVFDTKDYGLRIEPIYEKNKPWNVLR